jgi:hypothetical protein
MKQDDLAVRSEANVKFDPSATERLCFAQPGERVFGRACGGTAVADHGRENAFAVDKRRVKPRPRSGQVAH